MPGNKRKANVPQKAKVQDVSVFQALKSIETNFGESEEARAKTVVYLCLALNPHRKKMVNPVVSEKLGFTITGTNRKTSNQNAIHLKDLAKALEKDPESTRREMLHYMADVLMESDWEKPRGSDAESSNLARCFNQTVKKILTTEYNMEQSEVVQLANICMDGAMGKIDPYEKTNIAGAVVFSGSMAAIGGYFGGEALVAGLAGAGLVASATVGGAIIVGAMILAAAAVALIIYGIYSLVNHCKNQHSYFKAAETQNKDQPHLAQTVQAFMDDSRPSGEIPSFTK